MRHKRFSQEEGESDEDAIAFSKNDIDLSGYAYVGGVETLGCKVIKVTFKSNDAGVTLKSFRFQGDAEKWFKDDAVIGTDGNPISGDTEVTSEGVTVSIDLEASGLLGFFHMHAGGFDGSTGSLSVEVKGVFDLNTVPYILATAQN